MLHILHQIARTGIKTETAPSPANEMVVVARLQENILRTLGRALTIRQVDAGSCNGCELEIHALGNPYYNIEGLGIRFVASPRHADMLLVTGPVSKHMAIALKRTYDATPDPKLVVAVGDCAAAAAFRRAASLGPSRDPGRRRNPGARRRAWRHPGRDQRHAATAPRSPRANLGWRTSQRAAVDPVVALARAIAGVAGLFRTT
jgi:NADPH-dependent ferric siderophore reductase